MEALVVVTPSAVADCLTRNDLEALEQQVDDALKAGGIDVNRAMLVATVLGWEGWEVRPPLFRGGHWRFVAPGGAALSFVGLERILRRVALEDLTCDDCGGQMPPLPDGRQRGPRVDRRYCSDACRQRAYRQRRKAA